MRFVEEKTDFKIWPGRVTVVLEELVITKSCAGNYFYFSCKLLTFPGHWRWHISRKELFWCCLYVLLYRNVYMWVVRSVTPFSVSSVPAKVVFVCIKTVFKSFHYFSWCQICRVIFLLIFQYDFLRDLEIFKPQQQPQQQQRHHLTTSHHQQQQQHCTVIIIIITRMWANAQRDGRPAEDRWHPLFNAAKFGWRPLLDAVQ